MTNGSSASQTPARRWTVTLILVAVFFYWVALYLYAPTLPTYVASKTDNLALVGVVLSMYGLWQAVVRVPLGIAADWLGRRKPFILAGLVLLALAAYLMGSAESVNGILIGRGISGLGAGTWVPLVVMFSSLFPPKEAVRASAMLTMVGSAARMISTGLTGSLNQVGGYGLAFFLAAGAAALGALLFLPVGERSRPSQAPSLAGIVRIAARRDVWLPSLLSMIGQYANWGGTFGFVPILAKRLGATDVLQSILVSMSIGCVLVGNLLATRLVRRLGTRRVVYTSFLLVGVGLAGSSLAPSLAWIFVVQVALGFAQGIGYPVLMGMSIRDVAEEERSTAMGLHQAIYAVGMFAGPALSGVISAAIGIRPMFAITAAACVTLGLLGTRWMSSERAA